MKRRYLFNLLVIAPLMACTLRVFAQEVKKPDHRLSVRLNLLGVFNLDATGDVEYAVTNQIGVFAGGGSEYIKSYIPPSHKFSKVPDIVCNHTNWGLYAGMHVSFPIRKAVGLGIRPLIYFQNIKMEGVGCFGSLPTNSTPENLFQMHEWGMMMNVVYTQTFVKCLFIEPVLGFGPLISQERKGGSNLEPKVGLDGFWQLNLGVRF